MKEVKNTRNIGILIILSTILAMSGMAASVAAADGDFPTLQVNEFKGDVTINGADAPAGTIINAYVGEELRGSVETTIPGEYGNGNFLIVEGNATDMITFKIGGADADQTTAFMADYGPQNLPLSTGGSDPPSGGDPDPPPGGDPDPPSGGATGGDIGSGSGPGTLPADEAATTAPGDGDGLTPESHDTTGADDPEGADGGAKPATKDEPSSTGFFTGSGATALAVVGLLVIIALIIFAIKRRT